MSGQRSLRGEGSALRNERGRGRHSGRCDSRAGGGLWSFPRAAVQNIALAGERRWKLPSVLCLPPPRGPRLTRTPLLLLSSPPSPLRASPSPPSSPRLRRPSGAARLQLTGLESRLGAPDSRLPRARSLPLPPPRAPRRRHRRLLRAGPRPSRHHRCRRRAPPPPSTMGDAGSERSKAPSLPPRCPCGFWG